MTNQPREYLSYPELVEVIEKIAQESPELRELAETCLRDLQKGHENLGLPSNAPATSVEALRQMERQNEQE